MKFKLTIKACSSFLIVAAVLSFTELQAQTKDSTITMEEATQKIQAMQPKADQFVFKSPNNWSSNFVSDATIFQVSEGESADSARKLIDGVPYSTWCSNFYDPRPYVTIDLGKDVTFNRIVLFNRSTINGGSGDGNNATKSLGISVARDPGGKFDSLGTYPIKGPTAVCFNLKGGLHMCTWINNPNPTIIRVPDTRARFVKLTFKEASWIQAVPANPAFNHSVALSEFMLYYANADSLGNRKTD